MSQFVCFTYTLSCRHNTTSGEEHLQLHSVYALSVGSGGRDIFLGFATVSELLNLTRAYNSGWKVQLCMDATYGVCKQALGMIQMGVNSLGSKLYVIAREIGRAHV